MTTLPTDLIEMVLAKMVELGEAGSQEFFGVSGPTLSNWRNKRTSPTLAAAQKVWKVMLDSGMALPAPRLEGIATEAVNNPYGISGTENVVILMPSYDGVELKTVTTLFKCIKGYGIDKVSIIPGEGRTLIEEERNDLVAKYRRIPNKPEWVVFVDADQVLPCGNSAMLRKLGVNYPEAKAMRNALTRIMSHPKDALIVGGIYKNRRGSHKPACEIAYRSPEEEVRMRNLFDPSIKTPQSDKLEESGWTAMGWTRIHYSVFDRMEAASKNGGPLVEIAPPSGRESDPPGFFGRNSKFRGEDIFFCRRAKEIGISTFVDTGCLVAHIFKGIV